ncbi:hypothetical protein CK203_012546 [Vitis vinifera]|uniref:Uncharacterized protein n=1 Tax=Vitis vinifera TaxID=29760 RepID=A0A438KN31_VITVI|nr:hypothetical protein CK203_012546 [Vitis vinifera]
MVRFPIEKSNCNQLSATMRDFSNFIDEFGLVNPPLSGGALQVLLPRPLSKHSPILLDYGRERRDKRPFRFENMWLKALKRDLKKWNKEMFGNVSARKDLALELINYWDSIERLRPLFEEDKISQRNAKDEYSHLAILEETSWRQKSKALWLKEGDNNTKFFHRMANARRNGNFISSLTISGIRLEK